MLEPDPPEALGILDLHSDRDDRLGVGPASLPTALDPADVRLIDLHMPGEALATGTDHRHAIAVQHRPRGLIGAQTERPLDPERRDPVFLTGHLPRRLKPQPKRGPRAVKDRARGHRRLVAAHRALPAAIAKPPTVAGHAAWTPDPVRPAQPLEVVQTRVLPREPRQQLRVGARIVTPGRRHPPDTTGLKWITRQRQTGSLAPAGPNLGGVIEMHQIRQRRPGPQT
jgi:hypothetical protein